LKNIRLPFGEKKFVVPFAATVVQPNSLSAPAPPCFKFAAFMWCAW
jgi:hypothetical protein